MPIVDMIILLIIASFIYFGFKSGLISVLGRIVGVFIGAFIAGQYYLEIAPWFAQISFGSEKLQQVIAFIVIFALSSQLIGLIFYMVDKIYDAIAIIPGLKAINHLAGAILGFFEGVLVISVVLYIFYLLPFSDALDQYIVDSQLVHYFMAISQVIGPFIPDSLQALRQFIF